MSRLSVLFMCFFVHFMGFYVLCMNIFFEANKDHYHYYNGLNKAEKVDTIIIMSTSTDTDNDNYSVNFCYWNSLSISSTSA